MNPYIFVIAVAIAILPILIIYKVTIERIKEQPKQLAKAQTQFLIGSALSEVIPIILIVYGFSNLAPVEDIQELYIPGIIIILITSISAFFILLQRTVGVEKDIQGIVNQFAILSLSITSALPIISIIALVSMIP